MTLNPTTPDKNDKVLEGPISGVYGDWYFRQSDATGVQIYRSALSAMAISTSVAAGLALTTGAQAPAHVYDFLYCINLAAFGVALQTIHIYLKPLHNMLKLLWSISIAASLALAVSPLLGAEGLVVSVYDHPALLLAVGWQFVALAGLFVKEALCFGRLEAVGLIGLVPLLAGGHFLGVLSDDMHRYGALAFVGLFLLFSARKLTQNKRDDLGDLSVFEHLAKGGTL